MIKPSADTEEHMPSELCLALTPRLGLRRFTADDATDFYNLNRDAEVLKYTGDLPFENAIAARDFILGYQHYRDHGFGRWAIQLHSGEFIGFCGLRQHGDASVDLGFRLMRDYWGQGLAAEAARAAMVLAIDKYGLTELIARAMAGNGASIALLGKLGFTPKAGLDTPPWLGFAANLTQGALVDDLALWRTAVTLSP
ncbi:GNAT family N-acetyltransferase [Shewanella amazonensis]|nr:GNAT family N-acetyltransferase [Shewanella amazonensis]